MTRLQKIEQITSKLAELDDERLQAVADMIEAMDEAESLLPRELTDEELALIEQSREDFRIGRTYTIEEAEARTTAFLAERRKQRSQQ